MFRFFHFPTQTLHVVEVPALLNEDQARQRLPEPFRGALQVRELPEAAALDVLELPVLRRMRAGGLDDKYFNTVDSRILEGNFDQANGENADLLRVNATQFYR